MKIISLIKDGNDRLCVEWCTSPDLRRREIAAQTGGADLLWCGVAAPNQRPADVVDSLRDIIAANARTDISHAAVIRAAYWLTAVQPRVDAIRGRVRRGVRQALWRPVQIRLSGLAGSPRTP